MFLKAAIFEGAISLTTRSFVRVRHVQKSMVLVFKYTEMYVGGWADV